MKIRCANFVVVYVSSPSSCHEDQGEEVKCKRKQEERKNEERKKRKVKKGKGK